MYLLQSDNTAGASNNATSTSPPSSNVLLNLFKQVKSQLNSKVSSYLMDIITSNGLLETHKIQLSPQQVITSRQLINSTKVHSNLTLGGGDKLLCFYEIHYLSTRTVVSVPLGYRVFLKNKNQHYIFRGTKDDGREIPDKACVESTTNDHFLIEWVDRSDLEFYCIPICISFNAKELSEKRKGKKIFYHVNGHSFHGEINARSFDQLNDTHTNFQKINVNITKGPSYWYNIGEFVAIVDFYSKEMIANENLSTDFNSSKKTIVGSSPVLEKSQSNSSTPVSKSKSILSASSGPFYSDIVKSTISNEANSDVKKSNTATLITSSLSNVVTNQSSSCSDSSSNSDTLNEEMIAQAIISKKLDFRKLFYSVMDYDAATTREIIAFIERKDVNLGHVNALLEDHKIETEKAIRDMHQIYDVCIRKILAFSHIDENDENTRVRKFHKLFSLDDELAKRIIEDRNTYTHGQPKKSRVLGALDDRLTSLKNCLKHVMVKSLEAIDLDQTDDILNMNTVRDLCANTMKELNTVKNSLISGNKN